MSIKGVYIFLAEVFVLVGVTNDEQGTYDVILNAESRKVLAPQLNYIHRLAISAKYT